MTIDTIKDLIKEHKRTAVFFGISFFLLIGAWISLITFCNVKANSEHVYTYNEADLEKEQDGLMLSMDIVKTWEDKTLHLHNPYGAQYDFVIKNTSPYMIKNYTVDIIMSDSMEIDSGWNGFFETDGNKVIFTADEPSNIVPAGEEKTFGAVMYSEKMPELKGYTIKGCWDVNIKDSGWYWTLIEFTSLLLAILIFRIYGIYKQSVFNKKIRKDDEIIEQSMKILTGFIDAKDAYTKDHSARVAAYAEEIGRRFGLNEEDIRHLYYITLMHDCGKITIPDEILKKEGSLTPKEFAIIKTHTTKGNELLKRFSALPGIGDGAHYHHERYDGYGYPSGLLGEAIPLNARIICVADAYDAMSSNRCYRDALSKEKILKELVENSGKQFDPKFVPYMIEMIEDGFVDKVKEKYPVI